MSRAKAAIEYRWAQGQYDRLPSLATELVRRQVAVIATTSTPAAFAAKAATTTIPIVFEVGFDPVTVGLVASLNRPGGNLTGVTNLGVEVGAKQLELLHELVPTATTIALLVNPTNRTLAEALSRDMQPAAGKLGLKLQVLNASTDRDFDTVFATLAQQRTGALVIGADTFTIFVAVAVSLAPGRQRRSRSRRVGCATCTRNTSRRRRSAGLRRRPVSRRS
jgi:ABC-type uncharacterized transport system substrate-binding protein